MKEFILIGKGGASGRYVVMTERELIDTIEKPDCFINGYYPESYNIFELGKRANLKVTKTYQIINGSTQTIKDKNENS